MRPIGSIAQCPRYLIVDGNGGWNALVPTRYMRWAASTELHYTTFCSDTRLADWSAPITEYTVDGQNIDCLVYSERGEFGFHCGLCHLRAHARTHAHTHTHTHTHARARALTSTTAHAVSTFSLTPLTADVGGECLGNANYSATAAEAVSRSSRVCTANELIMACESFALRTKHKTHCLIRTFVHAQLPLRTHAFCDVGVTELYDTELQ